MDLPSLSPLLIYLSSNPHGRVQSAVSKNTNTFKETILGYFSLFVRCKQVEKKKTKSLLLKKKLFWVSQNNFLERSDSSDRPPRACNVLASSRIQQVLIIHRREYTSDSGKFVWGEGGTHVTDQVDTRWTRSLSKTAVTSPSVNPKYFYGDDTQLWDGSLSGGVPEIMLQVISDVTFKTYIWLSVWWKTTN